MKKVVIITGASSGLGKELVKLYFQKNYSLVLSGRNQNGFEEFKNKENVDVVLGDLVKKETLDKIEYIIKEKYKRVDILINNAGVTYI